MRESIKSDIKAFLREEVGFGCPVKDCGSPYLTYHHFNPPWHKCKIHNPKNMIALCLGHHKEADYGIFSDEQLYNLKAEPYLRNEERNPTDKFNWIRKDLIFHIGNNWFINPDITFKKNNIQILRIYKNFDGLSTIDFSIYNKEGHKIFEMLNNDWVITSKISDLECPPSRHQIKLKSDKEGFSFNLKFELTDIEKLKRRKNNNLDKKIIDMMILNKSDINIGDLYKSINENNFYEKINEIEKIKSNLDYNQQLSILSFLYKSECPRIHITENKIKISDSKAIGSGNLFYNSVLEVPIED
ncbi:hypothetical protein [Natronoflexus pectinivorans]|uniref:HNH nuclease domain-containing protein n=1 Tax=Natronoflexus pectinivorans TaxID=682526 RepID=A0A4R2GKS0_9BACT|nr:hypothetical protein [Natronoflexus pectinivorans]TCO09392.1 hypothetical protein EV194_103305 [Natronoflexus pectinivorans]